MQPKKPATLSEVFENPNESTAQPTAPDTGNNVPVSITITPVNLTIEVIEEGGSTGGSEDVSEPGTGTSRRGRPRPPMEKQISKPRLVPGKLTDMGTGRSPTQLETDKNASRAPNEVLTATEMDQLFAMLDTS